MTDPRRRRARRRRARRRRVVVALDSFKGSIDSLAAGRALAEGWTAGRGDDHVVVLAAADGGEGSAQVVEHARTGSRRIRQQVSGPTGAPVDGWWLLTPDGLAIVEVAVACGLPLLEAPDPLHASTAGVGELLRSAATHPEVRQVAVALGGSATSDGGAGALQALGADLRNSDGGPLSRGGGSLSSCSFVGDPSVPPPPDGVICLADVTAPLLGPRGAAHQFGPQKGAAPADVQVLEDGLQHWSLLLGGAPDAPGAGAAGGTAYGLVRRWGATITPGATWLASLSGLEAAIAEADIVVTGEGRVDAQSWQGKVVGHVTALAERQGADAVLVAGSVKADAVCPPAVRGLQVLSDLAGSAESAMTTPERWLRVAGAELAAST